MTTMFLNLCMYAQDLVNREEGQDLVEYALLISMISLATIASINGIASAITGVFGAISTQLTSA
jgi:pilus assembly protein Flp/PilA